MSSDVSIDVQIASIVGDIPDESVMQSWVQDVIDELNIGRDCEVSVRIVDEEEGRELNKRYCAKDTATNVLSFPADNDSINDLPPELPQLLGDIVICGPVVLREAVDQQKKPESHWAHLLVHGTLHLLGHDHVDDAEADEMEAIEARILARRGVANPYAG